MSFMNALYHLLKTTSNDQDIYTVFESVNWIWRATGVLIVIPKGPTGCRKFVPNKFLMGYNIVLFLFFIASFIENVVDNYIQTIVRDLGLDVKVHMFIRRSINWITMLNAILWKMITNNKFIEAINSLETQDRIMNELGCRLNYRSSSIKIAICVRSYFITTFLLTLHEFVYYGVNFSMLFDWLSWWFPLIIHKTNVCLYLSLVWIIGIRFNALNKKLDFIVKSSSSISLQLILDSGEYISVIRSAGNVHAELCKIVQNLNHIFVITLMSSALEALVFVTLILFSLILEIQGNKDYLALLSSSFLLIVCSIPIITIVMICNWTMKQASLVVKLVHEIKVLENNNALSDMIQIFSMQMLHQNLSFSVGGFFTLDPSLLQSITAVITSYLIILIQFGQMDNILLNKC